MTTETQRKDLDGLGIAVTGAAGDLGGAMALELASAGRRRDDARPRPGGRGAERSRRSPRVPSQVDVTDRAAVDEALAAIEPLDVVIGNAGIVESAPFLDVTQAQWQAHLDVNVTGCFNVGQAAARLMVERGTRGQIIFTGSWVGEIPWPEISAYSVSKAGVRMLARSMARELAGRGIRVNVVAPGDRDGGHGAAPVRDRPGLRAPRLGRDPARRVRHAPSRSPRRSRSSARPTPTT